MQPPKLNCDQHVCVLGPQWIGTIWQGPLPLTWVPGSLVCKEAQHRPVKPLHTWPHGCNLAKSVWGQITDSGWLYPKGYTQVCVRFRLIRCIICHCFPSTLPRLYNLKMEMQKCILILQFYEMSELFSLFVHILIKCSVFGRKSKQRVKKTLCIVMINHRASSYDQRFVWDFLRSGP